MDKLSRYIPTTELIHKLRLLVSTTKMSLFNTKIIMDAADRLEELDERVAIMTEHEATDADIAFPLMDDEIGGDDN